jgi:hypothetical protein
MTRTARSGEPRRLLVCGTGNFAARMLLDIAAVATRPTTVHLSGRNRERLACLAMLANARAAAFDRPLNVVASVADLEHPDAAEELVGQIQPHVVLQAASTQTVSVLRSGGSGWTDLVRDAGYSVTMVFQALITMRVARAIREIRPEAALFNCCFPDVVNSVVKAAGLPVLSGVGNIAILASVLRASLPPERRGSLRMLAHYRNLKDWRAAQAQRTGPAPRVWLDEKEVADVYRTFADCKLTSEPVPDISAGSAALPVLSVLHDADWRGHLPGCLGLPGGYPAAVKAGHLDLDLPDGISREEAVRWNARFEEEDGVVVAPDGYVRYTGRACAVLGSYSRELAAGFHVDDLDDAWKAMSALRDDLSKQDGAAG